MLILSVTANQQPDYLKSQLKNTAEMKLCIYDQWEERQWLLRGVIYKTPIINDCVEESWFSSRNISKYPKRIPFPDRRRGLNVESDVFFGSSKWVCYKYQQMLSYISSCTWEGPLTKFVCVCVCLLSGMIWKLFFADWRVPDKK